MSHAAISEQGFNQLWSDVAETLQTMAGHLTDTEARFLTMVAAIPSSEGVILEIGSFKGRSTIALAKAAKKAGAAHTGLWAVDPFTSPTETCPDLEVPSSYPEFCDNLKRAGVTDQVEVFQGFSYDMAPSWKEKIRFLWIDGDHTYKGAKTDFDLFSPFLEDGAIIAFHDTLHSHDGPCRVFANDILLSPNFGECGFSGSIAWARYHKQPVTNVSVIAKKRSLYKKLCKLVAITCLGQEIKGLPKLQYRVLRLRIPHGDIKYSDWIKTVA